MIAKQINQFVFSKQKMKKNWIEKNWNKKKEKGIKVFHFTKRKAEKKI